MNICKELPHGLIYFTNYKSLKKYIFSSFKLSYGLNWLLQVLDSGIGTLTHAGRMGAGQGLLLELMEKEHMPLALGL